MKNNRFQLFILLTTLGFGLVFLLSWWQFREKVQRITQDAISQSMEESDKVAERLAIELREIEAIADTLINLGVWNWSEKRQVEIFKKKLSEHPEIHSLGIVYEHDAEAKDVYVSKVERPSYLLFADSIRFAQERRWYEGMKGQAQAWSDSLFSKGNNHTRRIQYGRLISGDQGIQGALFVQLSIREIQMVVGSAQLGKAGYGFVIGPEGQLIHHPVSQWLIEGRNIFQAGYASISDDIKDALISVQSGEHKLLEFINPVNGLYSWLFFEPIPGTNWVLGTTFFKEEMVNNIVDRRKHTIRLTLLLVGFLVGLSLSVYLQFFSRFKPYLSVVVVSAILLGGILFIIQKSFYQPILAGYDKEPDDLKIADQGVLNHFKEVQDSVFFSYYESHPVYIPTGIYVEHINFEDAHQVLISGYVWQQYDLEKHSDIRRGFIFPEADPNPELLNIEEAYHKEQDGKEVIGWYFQVALRKKFNYENFPFDWQNTRIKIAHLDFLENVLTVPDLDSYKMLNPGTLPGVKEKLEVPGWRAKESFFSYKFGTANTTFGVRPKLRVSQIPELTFNVYLQRVFIGPFVSNIFTITIVIILLFVAQVIETKKNKTKKNILVGSLGIIELSAAFFFVLILSHTSLRESLAVEELIFIDHFYFASYFMILLTCLNFMMGKKEGDMDHENKWISKEWLKIYYWPLILGIFFLVTAAVFY